MEEKMMCGMLTVYRERGNYLRRLEQFEKAKQAYDQAFEKFPDDFRLLTGRSRNAAELAQPHDSYENAEMALRIQPKDMNVRNVQARALYTLTEFERSLVINYRGSRVRKQPPYFQEGINQGIETLEDAVGKNAGDVMLDFLPLIKRNFTAKLDENEPAVKNHVSRIPRPEAKVKHTQMQIRKHQVRSRVLAMKYLGPMAYDKFFLQELLSDRRLNSANTKGTAALKALAEEALCSLTERQDMLRTQQPYYSIKYAEKSKSDHLTQFKADLLIREREINTATADRLIQSVENSMREGNMMITIAKAERMQKFLDAKTPHTLPNKFVYMDRLYRHVGLGILNMHRLSYRLSERGNNQRIAFLMGLQTGRPRSYDSVRAKFPHKFVDLKNQIEKLTLILDSCESACMKCWLMYELACLYNKQKSYALAKFYAKRCQKEAQDLGSTTWWLNGCYVLMSGDMQQANTNDVRIAVEQAYNQAKELPLQNEQIKAFLLKCWEVASAPISVDEWKLVKAREKQILNIMDEKLQVDTQVLFKRIATLPVGRRFKVLPSKAKTVSMECERKRYRQIGLSVIPGKEIGLPRLPPSSVKGFQKFN